MELDRTVALELADRNRLELTIEGITTGAQSTSVVWMRNDTNVSRNTVLPQGSSFFDGGGEVRHQGSPPCESRMYRVALQMVGYLPGIYSYTVSNDNTVAPVMSPVFEVQGKINHSKSFLNIYIIIRLCVSNDDD